MERHGKGCAPGKVILLGEHAVVYGLPAIVTALASGASAEARGAAFAQLTVEGRATAPLEQKAYEALLLALRAAPMEAHLSFSIPSGSGMGASAAAGVALARAIVAAQGREAPPEEVRQAAMAWETLFHGTPSGVDVAAALHGGTSWFRKGSSPVPLAVRTGEARVAVAAAAPPASTKQMVELVAERRRSRPEDTDQTIAAMGKLVERAVPWLAAGDWSALGAAFDECHAHLRSLGVSTVALDEACAVARNAGAWGAKLTGSGGGGSVVALLPASDDAVLEAWRHRGLDPFVAPLGSAPSSGIGPCP